jgi:hypothetical protein
MNQPISQTNSQLVNSPAQTAPPGRQLAASTGSLSQTDYSQAAFVLFLVVSFAVLVIGCFAIAASSGTGNSSNTAVDLSYVD